MTFNSTPNSACQACHHTWYARASNQVLICPHCGSDQVVLPVSERKESTWLIKLLIALIIIIMYTAFNLPEVDGSKSVALPDVTQLPPRVETRSRDSVLPVPELVVPDAPEVAAVEPAPAPAPVSVVKPVSQPVAKSVPRVNRPVQQPASPATSEPSLNDAPAADVDAVTTFRQWKDAQQQLENNYRQVLNDGGLSVEEKARRQGEYMELVNRKNKTCGSLDERMSYATGADIANWHWRSGELTNLKCHLRLNTLALKGSK